MTSGLEYVAPANHTGYGTAARRLMSALVEAGVDLTWTPLANLSCRDKPKIISGAGIRDAALRPYCHRRSDCDTILLHTLPEQMPYWLESKGDKRVVGYAVWESDVLMAHWVAILNRLDHLLVPCTWNRDLFRNNGVHVPISVLPHLPGPACPDAHPRWAFIPDDELVFYCIETWSPRKNLDQTVAVFRQCFTAADKVRLVVKTTPWVVLGGGIPARHASRPVRPHRSLLLKMLRLLPKRVSTWQQSRMRGSTGARLQGIAALDPEGAPVDLITDDLTTAEVEGLHRRGDCYFSLTHGEGFGLGAFDAAAAGKPVITTGWGGVLEYLDPALGGLVDWDSAPAWNLPAAGCWAQPRPSHAKALLRAFRVDPEPARRQAAAAQAGLHERFGAATLIPLLREILDV